MVTRKPSITYGGDVALERRYERLNARVGAGVPVEQKIKPAPKWPKTLNHPGSTVVFTKWMTTNARQRVIPSARFTLLKSLRPTGDVRLGRATLTKPGVFTVIVNTGRPVKVTITLHAKAKTGYKAFDITKSFRLK